jgi:hypothetical protein
MSGVKNLSEIPVIPNEIKEAALDGRLVLFIGAGVSRLAGLPSWGGLADNILDGLLSKGYINHSEKEHLSTLDPKKRLSISHIIAEQNHDSLDYANHLIHDPNKIDVYRLLNNIGCMCVTTNYDKLLKQQILPSTSENSTAVRPERVYNRKDFFTAHLDVPGTILHLHGCLDDPKSMVVTTLQYLECYGSEQVTIFLKDLFKRKTVLFIGYGLEEMEILENIFRRGEIENNKERWRFALQGYFRKDSFLFNKLHDYYMKSFGVHVIGFEKDKNGFNQLTNIIDEWSDQLQVRPPSLSEDFDLIDEILS